MCRALLLAFALLLLSGAARQGTIGTAHCIALFRTDAALFAESISDLKSAVEKVDTADMRTVDEAKTRLIQARLAYKRIAYFLEYFFFTSSRIYNRPPKNEIEEPHLEYMEPAGLQFLEALLFADPAANKGAMLAQCRLLETAAFDLPALLYQFQPTDAQVLESVRIELVRVMTLSITGFDAPLLKSGIREALVSLQIIENVLKPYSAHTRDVSVGKYLVSCEVALRKNNDFDSFDRLYFLTRYALPLQEHLGQMIRQMGLESNEKSFLSDQAKHLFSPEALATPAFTDPLESNPALVELGRKLFFETRLSTNGSRSCASCHSPALYFTDGLPKSIGIHPRATTRRNAPSLLYSSFQHAQFWDGRGKSLEAQIRTVIHDTLEMNGLPERLVHDLLKERDYRRLLRKIAPRDQALNDSIIYRSIAAYVRTLHPFSSDFDRYMRGETAALTESQKNGFNLFMGKAQCGTCHFAPLFNGLIPPLYSLTEFEILGTTASDDFVRPLPDADQGRFETRPTPYFRSAFKTPTVRNAAVTAPYMHNGAFASLEKVIEFYDKGGGAGLGLSVPDQTLSPAPLNLTEQEKSDLIAFLHALTDRL